MRLKHKMGRVKAWHRRDGQMQSGKGYVGNALCDIFSRSVRDGKIYIQTHLGMTGGYTEGGCCGPKAHHVEPINHAISRLCLVCCASKGS